MGKKYYGGIGTDKGFVMHSPENEYRYDLDDEFHEEDNENDLDSTSGNNDNNHDDYDDELDDFFSDLFSIKACIALAIESLFKVLMSRSMKRIDFVAVTLMLLVCTRVIGAVFIDSSSLSELNAFAFVVTLSALGVCTISEKYPANALTALVIACLPALIEVATACAVNGSDADAFNRITSWALVGCLGSAALLIVGTLIDPFGDEEESEAEDASMDGGKDTSTSANMGVSVNESEGTTAHEDAAYERVFFIPFWGAAMGATAALIWELAPYIAREIAYGTAPIYFSYMGGIV